MAVIAHTHPDGIAFYSDCPACTRTDRDRWRREYDAEKARVRRLEHDLRGAVKALEWIATAMPDGDEGVRPLDDLLDRIQGEARATLDQLGE